VVRGLTGLAAAAAVAVASDAAYAHGDFEVERSSVERNSVSTSSAQAAGEGGAREASGPPFTISVDLVLGWGKAPFAVQNLPTTGTQAITYSVAAATPTDVQSFIFAGSVGITKRVALGARLPLTFATFSPDGSAARSTTSVGNVELEVEYGTRVDLRRGSTLSLVGALGVALPTAQGDAIPSDLLARDASTVDQNAYDRFSSSRAAAWARGDEDDALFEPARLGIVPKIGVLYRGRYLSIEPSLKVENLLSTSSSAAAPYIGEIVPAVRFGYRVCRVAELALRTWANVRFAAPGADRRTSAAVEPGIAVQLGKVVPYAGMILPLTGLPFDDSFLGFRVGITGSF
jgi:hypothetical protein